MTELLIALAIVLSITGWLLLRKPSFKEPEGFYYGPVIKGKNYTKGMPAQPQQLDSQFWFEIDDPEQEVDYVLKRQPTSNWNTVTFTYRLSGSVYPAEHPSFVPHISLFLQKDGDNWRSLGFRRYCPFYLKEGTHTHVVTKDDLNWREFDGSPAPAFDSFDRFAIAFGDERGLGHGIKSNRVVMFTLLDIRFE